jgi:hypothetical protein
VVWRSRTRPQLWHARNHRLIYESFDSIAFRTDLRLAWRFS